MTLRPEIFFHCSPNLVLGWQFTMAGCTAPSVISGEFHAMENGGYFEDSPTIHFNPGHVFYIPLPIQRIGEGLLPLRKTFEEVDQIFARFTGLNGR